MELYARVRRAVYVEGKSERQVAREFGLARESVRKMLKYSVPPGYRRQQPPKRPKLDPWVGVIDQILEEDRTRPRKQRHTAKRIYQRLGASANNCWWGNSILFRSRGLRDNFDACTSADFSPNL